jgi:DNA-3-methyladenine glycosylase I
MIAYHDREWGVPLHDDRALFEFLILEGAQAGLSWSTILAKRERYRKVFADFVPAKVARFGEAHVKRLLADPGIVRNELKIRSAIGNARAVLDLQREYGSFDAFLWRYVKGRSIVSARRLRAKIPATSPLSDEISRGLRARGIRFVGSTIVYAFMQATGMVNDHAVECFRYAELTRRRR